MTASADFLHYLAIAESSVAFVYLIHEEKE